MGIRVLLMRKNGDYCSIIRVLFFMIISLLHLCSPILSDSGHDDPISKDIHDILPIYNIPKGIVPSGVKSYSFSPKDGSFTVEMERGCYVKFPDDQLVYYDKTIKGKLTYSKIESVSGIQAKKFFIWLPVTGLDVYSDAGIVEFHVGAFSKKFPAQQFQTIPDCNNNNNNIASSSIANGFSNYNYF